MQNGLQRCLLWAVGTWLFITGTVCLLQGAERYYRLEDLALEVSLQDPRISPDGQDIVLVVSRPNFEKNRFENELVLVTVLSKAQRVLTFERHDVRAPRWSPSGDRIAFLAAGANGKTQLFVMRMDGGEARPLTDGENGIKFFAWRPDGRALAFARADEAEKPEGEAKHNKSFEVGTDVYFADSETLPTHIWLVSSAGGESRKLTSAPGGIQSYLGGRSFDWSPDGKQIVFLSVDAPHSGAVFRGQLNLIDVDTGSERILLDGPRALYAPRFSPDGSRVGFGQSRGAQPFFNPSSFFSILLNGQKPVDMAPAIDRALDGAWMPDGKSVLVGGADRTRISAWLQPIGGDPTQLNLYPVIPASSFSIGPGNEIAFVGSLPDSPPELYFMSGPLERPTAVSAFNAELLPREAGRTETVEWENDGFKVNGVLIYPPDFQESQHYPLVLYIHGGPMSVSTEAFSLVRQAMAARGWLVFSPNYRGSNNMGTAFQTAVINDAGEGPGRDVMAGIEVLKKRGIVDENRIAVSGWSYGGYMTTWLIAHYSGWKAAVAGAAVTDWFDWYNLADLNNWAGFGLGGSPWLNDNMENYWRQSPIAYADQIRTPTLILSNTLDQRVTVTQSYKLFHALRDNKVPVEFIAYPIPGHFPADPVHRRDVFRRWIGWILKHFER